MNTKAFTLIEIIITLVLFAIVGVMVIPYYKSGVLTQNKPIERFKNGAILNDAMELIVRDYNASAKDLDAVTTLKTNVEDFENYYVNKCLLCSACSATTDSPYSIGDLKNALLVTITCTDKNTNLSEKLSHVFTIEN